ncbi:MAG: M48 family metallopeptidase [Acidobacteriota bacterium]|nr:M48 family metallopeptidase [Acidobacteriota bacterium]
MFELIRANNRRAAVLVAAMAALLFVTGYAVGEVLAPGGGLLGTAVALVVWLGMTATSWFAGDKIVLGLSRARKIEKKDHPVLWNVVEEMCVASGLAKMPDVYIIDEDAPNAFATGRDKDHAAVAVTAGLLETLTRDELQGVVAHELAHVNNRDVLYMTLVGVMLGSIVVLADVGTRVLWYGGGRRRTSSSSDRGGSGALIAVVAIVLMIAAPIVAQLMYFAISRRREYLADACGAVYTRYPEGLAGALEKIAGSTTPLHVATRATAPMYIVNPLRSLKGGMSALARTHPPTEERVRILRSLAGGPLSMQRYESAFRQVTGRAVGVVPAGSLAALEEVAARREPTPDSRSRTERVRETTDALWQLQRFAFLACACGTTLKVPPVYRGRTIPCPHCDTPLTSPAAGD